MPLTGMAKVFSLAQANDIGIIGDPVEHSLSPIIQNAALHTWKGVFEEDGNRAPIYHKFHVKPEELKDAIDMMKRCKLRGLNVTVPHKVEALKYLDSVEGLAKHVGAINTIVNNNGKLVGYNTDANGFDQAITHDLEFDPAEKTALLLGAGGTGRVIAHKLADWGMTVHWWNRDLQKAKNMIHESPALSKINLADNGEVAAVSEQADLVINSTSVGLKEGDGMPNNQLKFRAGQIAYDVVYHRDTEFLKKARASGARTADGLNMLVYQGAKAFELWTGAPAPIEVMRHALQQALKKV